MRSVDSWLDRFAYRHPKFGIPNLMYFIIAGTVAVFLLDQFSSGTFPFCWTSIPSPFFMGRSGGSSPLSSSPSRTGFSGLSSLCSSTPF